MPVKRLELTVSEELWDRLNVARGHEPRASFVKRALESALGEGPQPGAAPVDHGEGSRRAQAASASSVSSRAPVEKEPDGPAKSAPVAPGSAGRGVGAEKAPRSPATVPASSRQAFACPVARCEFKAKSPAAKCGMHGRTVVPVE